MFSKAPKDGTECPYRNGTFLLTCDIPESYPREPPEIRFVTFILHPNVSGAAIAMCMLIFTLSDTSRFPNKERWACSCHCSGWMSESLFYFRYALRN